MTTSLIVLITILVIALVVFVTWFLAMKADGKCPLCMLKAIGRKKFTIDIKDVPDYENGNKLPIMGWSSWNTLRHHISEESIYDSAKVLINTGLADAGYTYVNLDDCWQSSMRDVDGKLQGDLETFPSGIEELCRRINALGLKMGLYSSNGSHTCEDLPASLGNELLDARTIASWGVEYLKYDFCHHKKLSGSAPVIEYIDFNRKGRHAEYTLKPEHAKFTGRARIVKMKELPTGKGIGYINHGAGTASFRLNVESGGNYVMTIHSNKNWINFKRYMQVVINGTMYEAHFPSGHSFSPDARLQIEVKLQSGENTIVLQNPVVTSADSEYIQYKRMGDALKQASKEWAQFTNTEEKPITYSICEWGWGNPWNWGAKAGNMWRTTMDINAGWHSIVSLYKKTLKLYKFSSPGHVNDPDMLEVGNGKLNAEENKAHFTLWCMLAAPLVLGNDIRKLEDGSKKSSIILNILKNNSLILIDQDPLVKPAKLIKRSGGIDIIARPLYNGDTAICFFNTSGKKKPVEFEIDNLKNDEYLEFRPSPRDYEIHDLWSDNREQGIKIACSVPAHGVKVFRISR